MAIGVILVITEAHEHWHVHPATEHEHAHLHDEHHQHEHPPGLEGNEPHSHVHQHAPLSHAHSHVSDAFATAPFIGSLAAVPIGAMRYLPLVLLPMGFLVPPIAMLTRTGEVEAAWRVLRVAGLLLGLYAAVILPWSARDHELVVEGPFRFVRHPAYSGDLALSLGSGLATANLLLLLLWPLYVLGATVQSRAEDALLASKFGEAYRRYEARVGRFVPRLAQ